MQPRNDLAHITRLFNKFAGKEIAVKEDRYILQMDNNKPAPVNVVKLRNAQDPVLGAMKNIAEKHGLKLRIWWPGKIGTRDYKPNRVNAYLEKQADGKYRISNKFHIG